MQSISTHLLSIKKNYRRFSSINIENKKTASYFALTLSLVTLSFFGLFAIRPTLMTAVSLIKSVEDLKKQNMEYENKIGSLIRAQSEYEKIRTDLHYIETALPRNSLFSKIARAIERFSERENVTISQLQLDSATISTPSASGKLNNYGFSLVVSGSPTSISSFLLHLINWQRIININTLEFAQEGSSLSASLRLIMKGTAYYEP